ncbi:hypothetical protein Bbelb_375870 [Branchiostoma belcheri]|nr:hypothetical protein Bbelb_375870 [Branchiostoma belcheri]
MTSRDGTVNGSRRPRALAQFEAGGKPDDNSNTFANHRETARTVGQRGSRARQPTDASCSTSPEHLRLHGLNYQLRTEASRTDAHLRHREDARQPFLPTNIRCPADTEKTHANPFSRLTPVVLTTHKRRTPTLPPD